LRMHGFFCITWAEKAMHTKISYQAFNHFHTFLFL